mmetsp:Transcript_41939/g.51066  ORF Transcript_41939/g.51066 Transcript_41939/m.51066 type:complete len:200 (-) Transcript_41939:137-736(-)
MRDGTAAPVLRPSHGTPFESRAVVNPYHAPAAVVVTRDHYCYRGPVRSPRQTTILTLLTLLTTTNLQRYLIHHLKIDTTQRHQHVRRCQRQHIPPGTPTSRDDPLIERSDDRGDAAVGIDGRDGTAVGEADEGFEFVVVVNVEPRSGGGRGGEVRLPGYLTTGRGGGGGGNAVIVVVVVVGSGAVEGAVREEEVCGGGV